MNSTQADINQILSHYSPISLEEMDAVRLMSRLDTKYFFEISKIATILEKALPYYKVLEIDGKRCFQYKTRYFDTKDFRLYYDHHNGRLNRFKIRQRRYDTTGKEFFEIKFKNNKGQTLKNRIENNAQEVFNSQSILFLERKTPYKAQNLKEVLVNRFMRITLVSKALNERATIDFNLEFTNSTHTIQYPNIGILEIKQDFKAGTSPLKNIMHEMHILPDNFSKYCTGVASLYQNNIKINAFKPQLLKIKNF
jgi:hypothetical protein